MRNTLVSEPAHEMFEFHTVLGCLLGFGQTRCAPLRYEVELLSYAGFVLDFHAHPVYG